jgi:N,N'-diacetyllegionaminate synthase
MNAPFCTIIFELGLNHMGDEGRARRMVDELKSQGASHITIQVVTEVSRFTRNTDTMANLQRHCLSLEQNLRVIRYAVEMGLNVGATVTDPLMVEPLRSTGVVFFKILSGDLTYEPLIRAASATGLPVYLSTGAASLEEIARALDLARSRETVVDLRLIHTVLVVPTPASLLNLRNIPELSRVFGIPVAYGQHSDISLALELAVAAGARGVFVYVAEKKQPELPDGPHAVECFQAGALLERLRLAEQMMGIAERVLSEREASVRVAVRRSIVSARSIEKDRILVEEDIAYKRPRSGLDPWDLPLILGKKTEHELSEGQDIVETR